MKKIYNLILTREELDFLFALNFAYTEEILEDKEISNEELKYINLASKVCMKITEIERKEMLKNECKRLHE